MTVQWIRSLIFVVQLYLAMAVLGIGFAIFAVFSPGAARLACKCFCWWAFWTARWMVGLRGQVLGDVPQGEVLIAAKHQSFFDIMLIFAALPEAKFIMKRELLWTPFIGLYAWRLGCVPVARGKRGQAISKMVADVEAGRARPGQLVIYPQGTRVPPGKHLPYKVGTAVLREELGQPCIPVAANVGLFWPKKGILRKPGLATVEFLPALSGDLDRDAFLEQLEEVVETRSNALMKEAGFDPVR